MLRLVQPGQPLVFHGVSWATLEELVASNRRLRLAYDGGVLELMPPGSFHEICKTWFNLLLSVLVLELGVRLKCCGSTMMKRADVSQGVEPDTCYYLANGPRVRDWRALDLTLDPPPDLAIEIDITSSSLNRLAIYARLRVPEVWRYDGEHLFVHRLTAQGDYETRPDSAVLPFLPMQELVPLLERGVVLPDDYEVLSQLRVWVQTRLRPLWDAHRAGAANGTLG
jgi:Uma2 family endonuclease